MSEATASRRPGSVFGRVALVLVGVQLATGLLAVLLSAGFSADRSLALAASSIRLRLDAVAEEVESRAYPLRSLDTLPLPLLLDLGERFPDPVLLLDASGRVVERFVADSLDAPAPDLPAGLDTLLFADSVVVQVEGTTWGLAPLYDAEGLLAGGLLVQPLDRSLARELAPTRAAFVRALLVVGAVSLLVALVLGSLLTSRLLQPLRRITRRVERIGAGDYAARLDETGDDEIARLAHAVNTMAAQVEQSVETLRAADRLRRELVANVGHDLRTPLAAMQGYVEESERLVQEGRTGEATATLEAARRQSRFLTRLVGDLFELSVLEGAPVPLRREPVPLGELLRDAASAHRRLMEDAGVGFHVHLPPALPTLEADGARLLRLLDNLLTNARTHTPPGGTITLRAEVPAEGIRVVVEDTGTGITPDVLPRLFERYYRGDDARTRGEGTGLGLAIAATIARLHGGTLRAESEVGKGSTFTLELPGVLAG